MDTFACPNCGEIIDITSGDKFSCNSCRSNFVKTEVITKDSLKELGYQELIKKFPDYYNFEKTRNGGFSFKIPAKKIDNYNLLILFTLITVSFLPPGIGMLINPSSGPDPTSSLVIGTIFILVSLICVWGALYTLLDTVEIKVDKQQLTKTLEPIPIPMMPNLTIPTSNILQLYCKNNTLPSHRGKPIYNYHLRIDYLSKDDQKTSVSLLAMNNPEQIWAMELLIERALKIEDASVSEEHIQ